jgi:hypothetical protein
MIIPIPTYREEVPDRPVIRPSTNDAWVRWYMNCPSWKCVCGLTNFGRNEQCAKWTCKRDRPATYDGGVEWKGQ